MKKYKLNIWIPTFVISLLVLILACETQVETYNEFTKDGETTYVGTPDSVIIAPGIEKLEFTVIINADPKITSGVIQTKDLSFVQEFNVTRANTGQDTIVLTVDIPEGDYNFDVILKDAAMNTSIPYEINSIVYGDNYQAALLSRGISSMIALPNQIEVNWGNVPPGALTTMFTYEDADGVMQTLEVPNTVSQTIIESYKVGGSLTIENTFKPTENAIETFTSSANRTFPDKFKLDFAEISTVVLPFDASAVGCYGGTAETLTDGATNAFWHNCATAEDQYPFVKTFDLGVTAKVRGFKVDIRSGFPGRSLGNYQIWGTNDLTGAETMDINDPADPTVVNPTIIAAWEADAVAKGWVKLLDVTDNTVGALEIDIENTANYKYLRVVGIAAINGGLDANFNEFTFFASEIE
ncbi:hypothetical protein MWU65_00890 [Cellulophaga sp. F20128]|uniref:DUF4998 domain-containing protein n=1 Tax=Cellulophaga sp. F20128 TaxID=2926413 RepID=UPI001FF227DC|nr:DUF4998 domain-containing protein [Cellulophaga sp. F20128]MCK0155715.1 hypothetical protein [Cellulophaga sp. F20128]